MTVQTRRKRGKSDRSAKPKKDTRTTNLPEDLQSGIIMSIDPGLSNLGWAISRVPEDPSFSSELIDRGTIYGKGKGTAIIDHILKEVTAIQEKYDIDVLAIEDYFYIRSKHRGMFAVPALIGVLKLSWYRNTGKEALMVNSMQWKSFVCGNPMAKKHEVREYMKNFLSPEIITDIEEEFKHRSKSQKGLQDCVDAIAIGLYVCSLIAQNRGLDINPSLTEEGVEEDE